MKVKNKIVCNILYKIKIYFLRIAQKRFSKPIKHSILNKLINEILFSIVNGIHNITN